MGDAMEKKKNESNRQREKDFMFFLETDNDRDVTKSRGGVQSAAEVFVVLSD